MKPLYTIIGTVQHGKHRGKDLGYPTANIPLVQSIPSGIYVSTTDIGAKQFQSVTFIGAAETFDENDQKVETYILNFSDSLYGKEIAVSLLSKLRDNEKFSRVEDLVKQIEQDIRATKKYFSY